ncbi:hypothetical protein SAMN05443249_2750 [Beijerinckia sp. 28-YEA-48]|nr:hypothetical protein SAMN05443249_2750 [Beijerinckia sp. 28-YEA-48]
MIDEYCYRKFLFLPRVVEGRICWWRTVWVLVRIHSHIGGTFIERFYYLNNPEEELNELA